MISFEIFMAVIIAAIAFFISSIVLGACFAYHKDIIKKLREPTYGPEMSLEELQKLIEGFYGKKEQTLEEVFLEFLNEKDHVRLGANSDGNVDVVADCVGRDCECHPTREDCCSTKDGKCHIVLNLNKLCKVEDIARDPTLLTEQEVQILTEAIERFNKEK